MSLLNPWVLLGILAALGASFVAGMSFQDDRHDAQLLVQERAMHESYVAKISQQRAIAQATSMELNNETSKRQTDAVAFRAELARAKAGAVQLAVCGPVGTGVRLTSDFSRLYDRALEIGMPAARDSGRADVADPRSDPVDPADVLANHADNAEAWAECRAVARGWQAIARRYGWVK